MDPIKDKAKDPSRVVGSKTTSDPIMVSLDTKSIPGRLDRFYHGTAADLSPGDMVQPSSAREKESHVHDYEGKPYGANIDYAHATSNLDRAKVYADRASEKFKGNPKVYVVERLGEHNDVERLGIEARSVKGFRVVGRHS